MFTHYESMERTPLRETRVLAIFPTVSGFGFAIFEGVDYPLDWGVKTVRGDKDKGMLLRVAHLITMYRPEVIVTTCSDKKAARHSIRVKFLLSKIAELCEKENIDVKTYSRQTIRLAFSEHGMPTKQEIAEGIARWYPELGIEIPPVRKIWKPDHYRMPIFDALSLALTFYRTEKSGQ